MCLICINTVQQKYNDSYNINLNVLAEALKNIFKK